MATATEDLSQFNTPDIQASPQCLVTHTMNRINAPASLVFQVLRNTETWKDWNHWVPRVHITYQPPDPDMSDYTEITDLVRRTSIAGSFDSDLTDGSIGAKAPEPKHTKPGESVPHEPLTLRRHSEVSGISARSNSDQETSESQPAANGSAAAGGTEELSAAQKYAAAQAARKASIASGVAPEQVHNTLKTDTSNKLLSPPTSPSGHQGGKKAKPVTAESALNRARHFTMLQLYGEPSVRIQLNTKMTFYIRMNPSNEREFNQLHVRVLEVSRPDDPITDGEHLTQLTRSPTHTLARESRYRIVWEIDSSKTGLSAMKNGSAFPKSLLQAQRVHEIRPIYNGDGSETCEYKCWEVQKGPLVKIIRKKYGPYIQEQFTKWNEGIGAFCEAMGGKVDRRDFSIDIGRTTSPKMA